jgi:NodT family efflux transporter outer membrane factor (OMF) lipoprotein
MAATNAEIGVQTAAYFPDITLNASAGYTSVVLGKLLQASSGLWSFGPSIAETVFDAGEHQAAVEAARATYDQAVANYRQTVLTAFQQVEDNLASLRILAEQAKQESAAVTHARQAETLVLNQYQQGIVPYNNVLTAQITRLNNEQTALSLQGSRLTASVGLIQAIGGGWDTSQLPKN